MIFRSSSPTFKKDSIGPKAYRQSYFEGEKISSVQHFLQSVLNILEVHLKRNGSEAVKAAVGKCMRRIETKSEKNTRKIRQQNEMRHYEMYEYMFRQKAEIRKFILKNLKRYNWTFRQITKQILGALKSRQSADSLFEILADLTRFYYKPVFSLQKQKSNSAWILQFCNLACRECIFNSSACSSKLMHIQKRSDPQRELQFSTFRKHIIDELKIQMGLFSNYQSDPKGSMKLQTSQMNSIKSIETNAPEEKQLLTPKLWRALKGIADEGHSAELLVEKLVHFRAVLMEQINKTKPIEKDDIISVIVYTLAHFQDFRELNRLMNRVKRSLLVLGEGYFMKKQVCSYLIDIVCACEYAVNFEVEEVEAQPKELV